MNNIKQRKGEIDKTNAQWNNDGAHEIKEMIEKKKQTHLGLQDKFNCALLIVLYCFQGVPVGLAFGSVPYLLKRTLSYSDIGFFSLAAYPYSLKLFWSPIVDSYYNKSFGRRKTWIVPIQILSGILFIYIGSIVDELLEQEHVDIYIMTYLFFTLVFCAATQDIAVDGWALELLPKELCEYASTCQTIGINIGYFMSFTIFLALNSREFCEKYLAYFLDESYFNPNGKDGVLTLGIYMQFWGVVFVVFCVWIGIFKQEVEPKRKASQPLLPGTSDGKEMGVRDTYLTMLKFMTKGHMVQFIVFLLVQKIGFMANDAVTALLLIEKGFKREDLALTVLLDFPCQIFLGIYVAKWSTGSRPTRPWLYAMVLRLVMCLVCTGVIYIFPSDGIVTTWYFVVVVITTLLTSFSSTTMFVSQGAFFSRISDPTLGGSYLTLLATCSNFGGTWPKYFVLKLKDHFTVASCSTTGEECISEAGKQACKKINDAICNIEQEGYYHVSFFCVIFGALIYVGFLRPTAKYLESLDPKVWKVMED